MKEALLNRLTDESTAVVSAVLELADALPRHQLRDQLTVLAAHCWHSNSGLFSLGPVALSLLQSHKGNDATVLLLVLPYLLPDVDSKLPIAKAVLKSAAVKKFELLKPLGKSKFIIHFIRFVTVGLKNYKNVKELTSKF